jgi:hypothetical protein
MNYRSDPTVIVGMLDEIELGEDRADVRFEGFGGQM